MLSRRGFLGAVLGSIAAFKMFGAQVPDWTIREKEDQRAHVQYLPDPIKLYVRYDGRSYTIHETNQRASAQAVGEYVWAKTGAPVKTSLEGHVFLPGGYEIWDDAK